MPRDDEHSSHKKRGARLIEMNTVLKNETMKVKRNESTSILRVIFSEC